MPTHTVWASLLVLGLASSSVVACVSDVLSATTHFAVRELLLRGVALVFAINFLSVATQARGLIGPDGVLPVAQTLRGIEENLAHRDRKGLRTALTARCMSRVTVAAWRAVGVANVRAAAVGGCALGLCTAALPVRQAPRLCAGAHALLYAGWYVYKRALGTFANLQWDMLLLEAGALCALLALAGPSRLGTTVAVHLVRCCVVRLHCGAGVAKLTSGDPYWASLTAMAVHHETQPLPTRLARRLHALPLWAHRASTAAALALELGTAVACWPSRWAAELAAAMVLATQAAIAVGGFYGYFSVLSALLGVSLLSDRSAPLIWWASDAALPGREGGDAIWATAGVCALAAPCMLLYVARAAHYTNGRCRWFAWLDPWLRTAEMTFCVANRFSLFSNMTVPRRELTIEGTDDGVTWTQYECRYKPSAPDRLRADPLLIGHMPRLDWRLWLLAQGYPAASWLDALLARLADGSGDVLRLFAPRGDGLPWGPRLAVRARRWEYAFAAGRGGPVWERKEPVKGGGVVAQVRRPTNEGE